jgi:phosphatidylserine decarboxylase
VLLLPDPDAVLAGPALWPALGAVLLLSALQFTGAGETAARALADGITPAAGRIFALLFPFLLLAAGFWSAMSAESTFLIWRGILLWGGLALLVTLIANFLIVDLGVREYARFLEQEGERAKRGAPLLLLLSLLPSNLLSRLFGVISRLPVPRSLRPVVYGFYSRKFGVNLAEAALPVEEYPSLGQFFIRYLKPGLRPIDPRKNAAISPVDGTLAQFGPIVSGALIQAKGLDYSLHDLLPDCEFAREFEGGAFCTIYLSPRDYHRIHTPCAGELVGYDYVPGYLLPVNLLAVENVRDLFPKNERLTTFLRSGSALVAVVKVGATNVGRIRLAYDEHVITNGWRRSFHPRQRYAAPRTMEAGAELARFEMGSTVVLLFSKGALKWQVGLRENSPIRLGESLGTISG